MGFYSVASGVVNTASLAPSENTTTFKMQDENKKQRMELLTYVKAHFDLIAVTLLIGYLGYSLYLLNKKKG